MKKKILTFLITLGVVLLPLTTNASLIDEYEHKNLKDTLAAESMELKIKTIRKQMTKLLSICLEVKDVLFVDHF